MLDSFIVGHGWCLTMCVVLYVASYYGILMSRLYFSIYVAVQ